MRRGTCRCSSESVEVAAALPNVGRLTEVEPKREPLLYPLSYGGGDPIVGGDRRAVWSVELPGTVFRMPAVRLGPLGQDDLPLLRRTMN